MPWCGPLAHFKTIGRRRPWYAAMPPPSGDRAATTLSATAALTGATSSSTRVSRAGGPGQVNYELGRSKTSWRRVKEMESLGFFAVGCGRGAGAETIPRTNDEVLVFRVCFSMVFAFPAMIFWLRSSTSARFRFIS
jgi:murein endopeptidase